MLDLEARLRSTLGEHYAIERELSGGGMSRVFVATESGLNRRVVVKVLRPEVVIGASTERFEREMAVCARCQHPHIVPLLTAGHVGDLPYFTMPFVEGESLRERLHREGPLPIAELVRLMTEVADALAYAHRHGVIHRDIKPENILIQDGHAVVADFGVAKALDLATGTSRSTGITGVGTIIGTPAYMAPEQATGDPGVDHRADLYALGVLGYELLTGKLPFAGSVAAVIAAQISQTAPPVSRLRPNCPPALDALVARLLAANPAARPASADAVRGELQAIGAALSGRPRGWRRYVPAGLAVLGLGLFAVLYLASRRDRQAEAVPEAGAMPKSVAVLPFQTIGGDSASDYFSMGIAEELISALGKLPGLRVASRTSSFAAREQSTDLREIGRRLGVGAVLEGTVQQIGPRVRVSARLVDVGRDTPLWSGDFRSELRDVFAVQDTIAHAIAAALRVTLAESGGPRGVLVARGTRDSAAHDLYLQGRYYLALRTPASLARAIDAFEAAVERDSAFALAYSGLADAIALMAPFGGVSPRETYPRARAAALRALALDSTLAEVHTSFGFLEWFYDWNVQEGERRFRRALAINPNYSPAHLFRAWLLAATDRGDEAIQAIETARLLDPLSIIVNARRGTIRYYTGRDQEAVEAFRWALQLDSTFATAKTGLAITLARLGRCQEALAIGISFEQLLVLPPSDGAYIAATLALCGKVAEVRQMLARLMENRRTRYVSAHTFAQIHAALGDREAAFAELDRALQERSMGLGMARVEPILQPLRSDPRWAGLMQRMGLPP
ncbi:MAG: protein kinase domain-containing protein [Gemmatimonadales bacterium]